MKIEFVFTRSVISSAKRLEFVLLIKKKICICDQ